MTTKQTAASLVLTAALSLAGCGPSHTGSSELSSDVSMNSSRTAKQLLTGFYNVENGAWRWTAKNFSIALSVPSSAATKGGTLSFRLVLTDASIRSLHSVTLSARIKDTALIPETYTTPGDHVYTRDVPAAALANSPVRVDFMLDKATPPGPVDIRELGVVANEISLTAK